MQNCHIYVLNVCYHNHGCTAERTATQIILNLLAKEVGHYDQSSGILLQSKSTNEMLYWQNIKAMDLLYLEIFFYCLVMAMRVKDSVSENHQ